VQTTNHDVFYGGLNLNKRYAFVACSNGHLANYLSPGTIDKTFHVRLSKFVADSYALGTLLVFGLVCILGLEFYAFSYKDAVAAGDNCYDYSSWTDSRGYSCLDYSRGYTLLDSSWMYSDTAQLCETDGDSYASIDDGYTANKACCACSGGLFT